MTATLSRLLSALGLLAVSAVLVVAFADQLIYGDLPCPLCLLQRAAFAGAALGLALNVRFGPRPSHWAMVIVSAFCGALISGRQTLLHIVPGSGTYGDALFGMHFYTWAFVLFGAIILGSALMLLFDRQFAADPDAGGRSRPTATGALGLAVIALALLLALGNGVSTVLECAGGLCPDNPTTYILLNR